MRRRNRYGVWRGGADPLAPPFDVRAAVDEVGREVLSGGSLRDAHIKDTRFEGADLREADLGGLKLLNAKLFLGATISPRQAAALVREMGMNVA